jgi:magnesium transporter
MGYGLARMPITPDQLHDPILSYVRPPSLTLDPDETIGQALEHARSLPSSNVILYCYCVDKAGRLVGFVPIRRLLTTAVEEPLRSVMIDDVMAIPSFATVLVAAEYFVNHRLLAFPVVEPSGKLVGVVDVNAFTDEVLSLAKQSYDGIYQLLGIHATAAESPWSGFKDRFPWLLCNVGGGLMCAVLSSRYEHLLNAAVVLALFIPVVLALAESVSIQSVTLTLQNMQSGAVQWKQFGRSLLTELMTAVLLGLACGCTVGAASWVWKREPLMAAVLACAIAASMVTACLFGVVLPTLLRLAKADPKIAAGPIVLAMTDLATLLFYFTVAGQALAV